MTFREFWPRYLQAHSHPVTRGMHYAATLVGVGSTIAAAIASQPVYLLGIGVAYAMAIGAHVVVEKNRSMIRINPIWGAVADLRMFWLAVTGGLNAELKKSHAVRRPRTTASRRSVSFPAT